MKRTLQRREESRDLEDNKSRNPRNNTAKRYFYLILLLLGIAIIGFASVFVLPFLARFLAPRSSNASSDDSLKILMQDLNEQTLNYPLHIHEAARTIEFCEAQPLTAAKFNQLFKNARIAVHQNSAKEPSKERQEIKEFHFSSLKVSQRNYSKFTNKQVIKALKNDFIFAMQEAHPVAQRLMSIFLSSHSPRISIYTDLPTLDFEGGQIIGGRYIITNNTVRLITKLGPGHLVAHEGSHAGAAIVTYGTTLWNNGSFKYPVTPKVVNGFVSKSFPCDQEGFYEVWEDEVDQVLSYGHNINDPQFLDIAKEHTPKFAIWLSEKSIDNYANHISVNATVTLDTLSGTKIVISPGLSQYNESFVPDGTVSPSSYYQTVLLRKPVKVVEVIRDTEFPGIAAMQVRPLAMEPKVKAHYLLQKFGAMKNYANSFRPANGHCQEAFGISFELNRNVIDRTLPRSISYLGRRLDDYERERCQEGGSRLSQ